MKARRYGQWPGRPEGDPEDVTKCIEEVFGSGRSLSAYIGHQCRRKRGFGPGGLYCKQHAGRAVTEIAL